MFVRYSAAFCQLCFYNKDWIGLDWIAASGWPRAVWTPLYC